LINISFWPNVNINIINILRLCSFNYLDLKLKRYTILLGRSVNLIYNEIPECCKDVTKTLKCDLEIIFAQVEINKSIFIAPAGFWPRGQDTRRHISSPRTRKRREVW